MRTLNNKFLVLGFLFCSLLLLKSNVYSATDTQGLTLGSNPKSVAINPITGIAAISNEQAGSVSIIDQNLQTVIATIQVGRAPKGVAIDCGFNMAVIANSKDNTISFIDLNSFSVIKTMPVGKEPEGVAVNSSTHKAIVSNYKDDTVSIIDLVNFSVSKVVAVGKGPREIAIDPELGVALVVNEKDNDLSVLDLAAYRVKNIIAIGQKPSAIDINPETHLAMTTNEKSNSITVINLLDGQISAVPIGKHPIDIAINRLDNRALVICDEDRTLLRIDLDTKSIIGTYALNKLPRGVAINNLMNIALITDDKTDSLTLIHLPNPVPLIKSVNPDNMLRGNKVSNIFIEGSGFIAGSAVTLQGIAPQPMEVEIIDNHSLRAAIPDGLLQKAGAYQIAVTNPSPAGGQSNSAGFTVNNPVPFIFMLEPPEAIAGADGIVLTIYGTGLFDDTEVYFGGIRKQLTYVSNSKIQIYLAPEDLTIPGLYEITARNSEPGGGSSNKLVFKLKSPLEIRITSPTDGDIINKAKVLVKGTVKSDTKDIGVKVNGTIADISGTEWIANNVPLGIGSNVITATVTDSHGNKDTKAITIKTDNTIQPVRLSVNIASGIAPLQALFSASTQAFTPASYQVDFEGDGVIDYTAATFDNVSHTYSTEGVFYPTVTVVDNQGNTYSDTIAISVLDKTAIESILKGKWEGMKEALKNKDTEGAIKYFVDRSKERYSSIFVALKEQLPSILETFIEFNVIDVYENLAEYEIVANENGVLYSYPGLIIRDADGVWKFRDF